jgi:hypothetical protein
VRRPLHWQHTVGHRRQLHESRVVAQPGEHLVDASLHHLLAADRLEALVGVEVPLQEGQGPVRIAGLGIDCGEVIGGRRRPCRRPSPWRARRPGEEIRKELDLNKPLRNVLYMPYDPLTKNLITRALRRLGELAQAEGVTLEVSLYGGAVFTLVYGSRDSTLDVDAPVRPAEIARRLAIRVGKELGLPEDWINDHVRRFLSEREAKRRLKGDEFGPGLQVSVPTAAYLLALKLRACRPPLPGYAGDYEDIRFLLHKMELRSLPEVEAVFDRFFPQDELSDARREVTRQLLKEAAEK